MKKIFLSVLAILCLVGSAFAQIPQHLRALQIGETLPDITLSGVVNHPTSQIRLQDLRGKLVILDFWSTWCAACIESFPKMQALQERFADKLQVILVNTYEGDSLSRVVSFLDKRSKVNGGPMNLPYSLQQYRMDTLFPRRYIPHYIWIDTAGVVAAITGTQELTAENIQRGLQGRFNLREKRDILDFDALRPLFVNGNGGHGDTFIGRSLLTGYQEGLGGRTGMTRNEQGKVERLYALNKTKQGLLQEACMDDTLWQAGRVVWKIKEVNSAYEGRLFCYELIMPPVDRLVARQQMKNDLLGYFQLQVNKRTIDTLCWVLTPPVESETIRAKSSTQEFINTKTKPILLRYYTPRELARLLESLTGLPVIEETGLNMTLDLQLPANLDFKNGAQLQQAFKRAGLPLQKMVRPVTYMVVEEVNNP